MTNSHILAYRPAAGSLLIAGDRLVILLPVGQEDQVADLWRLAAAPSGMDDLVEWLVDRGFRSFSALTAVEFADSGPVRVLLRGAAQLHLTTRDGTAQVLSGEERRTWLDTTLSEPRAIDTAPIGTQPGGLPLQVGAALASGFAWPATGDLGTAVLEPPQSVVIDRLPPAAQHATGGHSDDGEAETDPADESPGTAPDANNGATPEPASVNQAPHMTFGATPEPAPVDETPGTTLGATPEPAPVDETPGTTLGVTPEPAPVADHRPDEPPGDGPVTLDPRAVAAPWAEADLTIDPFPSTARPTPAPPASPGLIDISNLPLDEPSPVDAFDQVFGATRKGTVEHAAVRIVEADDEPQEQDEEPQQPEQGDHDGHTITSSELARLRRGLASGPAAQPPLGADRMRAAICPNGHPNPPNQAACRVCGTDLASAAMQTVPRVVIGSLLFDDGQRVPLEGTIIVGRSPKTPMTPRSAIPALVAVQSPEGGVSRSHAEIRVEGWSASVVDLDSTNGTVVTLPGEPPRRLRRGDPCLITPGTVILLGDEVSARYEVAP